MQNPVRLIELLTNIKKLGVRIAIDDFGTGYSSLAQIQHFPIDTLKVDRSFIRNLAQDSRTKRLPKRSLPWAKLSSLPLWPKVWKRKSRKTSYGILSAMRCRVFISVSLLRLISLAICCVRTTFLHKCEFDSVRITRCLLRGLTILIIH